MSPPKTASRNDNNFDCPLACEQDWPGCPCRYDDLDNIRYVFPLGEIFSSLLAPERASGAR